MPDSVCVGATKNYWVVDTPGSTYTWTINGAVQPETSSLISVNWTIPGNYTITVQELSADNCLGDLQAGEVVVTENLLVSVSLLANFNPVCFGENVLFTATPLNGGTNPVFSWFVDGGSGFVLMQTGPDDNYTYSPQNGDQVYVMLESDEACATGSPADSEVILMQVDPLLPVTVSIDPLPPLICEGTEITLNASSGNGGPNPVFSWFVDAGSGYVEVQTGPDNFYTFTPVGGEQIYVELLSDVNCGSGNPAASEVIQITVSPLLQASVTIVVDNDDVCAGTEASFTATPVNGGLNPVFAWYVNSALVPGETSATYSYIPVNGDIVEATLISDETCVSTDPVTSNIISMTVNQLALVAVGISADANPVCEGSEVNFTATYSNEGPNPQFAWFVNGSPVGLNQDTYSYFPLDGDEIQVVLLSDAECVTGNPATSNLVVITVTDEITPTFAAIGPLCLNSTAPLLELTSLEGITGTWSPAVIATGAAGTFIYTFTPDADQCAIVTTLDITITDEITPTFAGIGPLCLSSTPPLLELTSLEGITGTWSPAVITTNATGTFTYTYTPDADQCAIVTTLDITITDEITPTFAGIGPLCLNSTAPLLELISLEGITGTWSPAVIATSATGTFTYTFTPDAGQCSVEYTMTIVIDDEITPEFAQIGPLCLNSTPPALPTTSINGITGSWTPAVINTTILGPSDYVFTPDAGQCGVEFTMSIVIDDEITPEFAQIGPLCLNSTPPALPTTSINGITGSWTPAVINTTVLGASDYIFTPDAGQCGVEFTMSIVIDDEITPEFAQIGPLCLNSTPPALPTTSINGITGNWTPAVINTTILGPSDYIFTPDAGQCGVEYTMTIVIDDEITPEFAQIGPLCLNSTPPALPTTSINGITGSWTPAVINTTILGASDYIFTPDAGQCAAELTFTVVIDSPVIINIETTPATNGMDNGMVTIIASGGVAPLQYSVNGIDWQLSPEFTGLAIGDHTAYVQDANGCIAQQDFNIGNAVLGEVVVSADMVEYCMNVPIILPVGAENFVEVASFTIELTYDPAILTYLNLTNVNPILSNAGTFSVSQNANVLIVRYSAISGSVTLPAGQGLFGVLFDGASPGNSDILWNFDECVILGSEGYEIPRSLVPGQVELFAAPNLSLSAGGEFCAGDSTIFSVVNNDNQLLDYLWTGPGGFSSSQSDLTFNPLQTSDLGIYTLTATNADGCFIREVINLSVNPSPEIDISDSDSLCAGTLHFLDAGPGYENYLWQDGSVLQTYQASDAGEYRVEVVNSYGCTGRSIVWLIPCTLELTMPNAFTPDGNGINDIFRPVLLGDIVPSRFLMQIYNRWGELVYETNDYTAGWDGFVKGSLAPSGVYAYIISFEVPGYINVTVKSPVRGSVTLLR
jgi:gliding motility-associated-like protein